jgi:hypothetical protein
MAGIKVCGWSGVFLAQTRIARIWDVSSNNARALGRVSGKMLRRNKYIGAGIDAGRTTVAHTAKVAHALWLQVTGFVFCVFALVGGGAAWREYQKVGSHDLRFIAAAVFTAMFAYFGVSAFMRARR